MNKLIQIRKYMILTSLIGVFAMSCAPAAMDVMAGTSNPRLFNNIECDDLVMELLQTDETIAKLTRIQNKAHKNDKIFVGIGATLFWPLIFAGSFITGSNKEEELAEQMGRQNAIERAMKNKSCKE